MRITNLIYLQLILLMLTLCSSCQRDKSEIEDILTSTKSAKFWTIVDYNKKVKIDNQNIPLVFKLNEDHSIEQYFISDGIKISPIEIEPSKLEEKQWSYDAENKILKIGLLAKYKLIHYTHDSIVMENLNLHKTELFLRIAQ